MRWEPARAGERGRFWGKVLCADSLAVAREPLLRAGGAGAGMSRPKDTESKRGIRAAVQGRVMVKVEEAAEILLLYTVNARYWRVRFRLDDDGILLKSQRSEPARPGSLRFLIVRVIIERCWASNSVCRCNLPRMPGMRQRQPDGEGAAMTNPGA